MTRLRFWDRLLSALMGVLCIAAAAALVLYASGLLPVDWLTAQAFLGWQKWLIVGVSALVLVLIGLHGVGMLFRRRKDKGFVIQRTEYGDMSISMKAMENMVKKCVDAHSELTVNHTKIYLVRNGVSVDMKITLASGVNIPLTVNALQKQIKQYITSCSGVDVHEVRVKVETDSVKLLPPPQASVIEPAPVEELRHVESPVEHLYQHKEEPHHYAKAPVQEKAEEPAAETVTETVAEAAEEQPETTVEEPAVEEAAAEAVEEAAAEAEEEPEEETVETVDEAPVEQTAAAAEEANADA